MRRSNKIIIGIISLLVISIIGVTFAFYMANVTGNSNDIVIKSGNLSLTLEDDNPITLNNAQPGSSASKTFTVTNTNKNSMIYNIKLVDVINTFVDKNDLVFTLVGNNNINIDETIVPSENNKYLATNIPIEAGITHTYTLTIIFKETNDNQNDNMGVTFSGRINIDTEKIIYKDNSGANAPELFDNMIPIKYENNNWLVADTSKEWYDYDAKEWANAVVIRDDIIKDLSDNHNDITITNNYTNKNGMAYFDGVDDYLDFGYKNYDFGNTASMVLRFKLHSFETTRESVMFGNCENAGFYFRITNEGRLDFNLYNENLNQYIINAGPIIELDKWYTVVGTYDGQTINFYINGELYLSTSSTGEIKPSSVQFTLGANPQPNDKVTGFTNFTVSDALVYKKTLSEEEVKSNYSSEITNYNETDLLFGYNYFGSARDYYQKMYNANSSFKVNEKDIDLWYVWIPRYTYTIFNGNNGSVPEQEIQIKFERGIYSTGTVECHDIDFAANPTSEVSEICTDATNGSIVNGASTYTHPAFTFGDEELTGFWVGKFEVSGTTDKIEIKPNVSSLREQTVSSFFYAIQNMSTQYNLNGDSHMMKNMEWGAVAYLSHSKYGTCADGICTEVTKNDNNSYITGGGIDGAYKINVMQSTTQNIYGIYDMLSGSAEYVMGNMVDSNGEFYTSEGGFTSANIPDSKYFDLYSYSSAASTHGRGKLGDATKETLKTFGSLTGGWYDDFSRFPYLTKSWFVRSGYYNDNTADGTFYFYPLDGDILFTTTSRAVLTS